MRLRLQCFAMRALEITINGEKLCVAGVADDGEISAIVASATKADGDCSVRVSGLIRSRNERVKWIGRKALKVGDQIQIRIIETAQADEPAERQQRKLPQGRQIGGIIGPY